MHLQVLPVQISLVLVSGLVATMTVRNDGVEELLEDLIGLLITSNTTNSHNKRMTWRQKNFF